MCAYLDETLKCTMSAYNYISLILDYAFALKFGSWQNVSSSFLWLQEKTLQIYVFFPPVLIYCHYHHGFYITFKVSKISLHLLVN